MYDESSSPDASGTTEQVAALQADKQQLEGRNQRLAAALQQSQAKLRDLQEQIDQLNTPPSDYGIVLHVYDEAVDVWYRGNEMMLQVSPAIDRQQLSVGRKVRLSREGIVIEVGEFIQLGAIYSLREVLPAVSATGLPRAIVVGHSDDERTVLLAERLQQQALKAGDALLVDVRSGLAFEVMPKTESEQLVLEEVPDISYSDIGGLSQQIEQIYDAVELPYLHAELFTQYQLQPPKGVLLYGPPGCGKTMIAKAVAASLARKVREKTGQQHARAYFLNIKGPELLNKFVGETERHIREIFQQAREKASNGMPVIVFFDEMESLFRTRGSGVSSDMESTVVPQLLSEIDGVEGLENVLVIGASNREDQIDPAVLRPGRLDVKIKVQRPDEAAAGEIFAKYLTPELPINKQLLADYAGNRSACIRQLIYDTVKRMYSESKENQFIEVTYAGGTTETLYFKDFNSGAMIKNIVDRAKKYAIKGYLAGQLDGLQAEHLLQAVSDEFAENEDLPNTTSPDDWARVSGKKGERIVYIRTVFKKEESVAISRPVEEARTGQYL